MPTSVSSLDRYRYPVNLFNTENGKKKILCSWIIMIIQTQTPSLAFVVKLDAWHVIDSLKIIFSWRNFSLNVCYVRYCQESHNLHVCYWTHKGGGTTANYFLTSGSQALQGINKLTHPSTSQNSPIMKFTPTNFMIVPTHPCHKIPQQGENPY